jgi:hypothetical protein
MGVDQVVADLIILDELIPWFGLHTGLNYENGYCLP